MTFGRNQSRVWRLKNPQWAIVFKVFLTIQGKTMAKPFLSLFAPRLYNNHNHAHDPGQHLWPSEHWKSDVHVKSWTPVRAGSPLTKSKEKNLTRMQQYKSARVSTLTGSVPRKMAKEWQRASALAPYEDWTHVHDVPDSLRLIWPLSRDFISI